MINILVIEDNAKHLADARSYAAQLAGVAVDFATNLADALVLIGKKKYDAAISDVFFPKTEGMPANSFKNAVAVNEVLKNLGIHHVFNTAGNHHGAKYGDFRWKTPVGYLAPGKNEPDTYHFLASGMVIEAYPEDSSQEKDTKQWVAAFRYILLAHELFALPDQGASVIEACELQGFPYGEYGNLTEIFEKCANPFVVATFQKFSA
ncbi:MAG: hypothetical protein WCO09_00935 [bacterium]